MTKDFGARVADLVDAANPTIARLTAERDAARAMHVDAYERYTAADVKLREVMDDRDRALALLRRARGIVVNAMVMWGYLDQSDATLVAEIDALLSLGDDA